MHDDNEELLAVSLFSGAGIGDLGLRAAKYRFIAMSELEDDRIALARTNFPEATHYQGDIWVTKDIIVADVLKQLSILGKDLDLISCTAPCQGMSKNGQGTLLNNIRSGKRPKLDPRNRLIIPALEIITRLKPTMVVFENVPEMRRTLVEDEDGELISILALIRKRLGQEYVGEAYDIEFANYGIPQRRQRLITCYSKSPAHKNLWHTGGKLVPPVTHAPIQKVGQARWVTVSEAINDFPPLDAKCRATASYPHIPFHRVPLLDEVKYFWVENTPPGKSAFDNQCIQCGFSGNTAHSNIRGRDGINRSSKETPIYCIKCNSLLPRPSVATPDGRKRIMSGYTSAYKRMQADLPAPALTRNFSYACSDQKLHPYQNRVLSIAEAMTIHTISDYKYDWTCGLDKKQYVSDALIRLVIGESIPPKFMEILGRYLASTMRGSSQDVISYEPQMSLFNNYHMS